VRIGSLNQVSAVIEELEGMYGQYPSEEIDVRLNALKAARVFFQEHPEFLEFLAHFNVMATLGAIVLEEDSRDDE